MKKPRVEIGDIVFMVTKQKRKFKKRNASVTWQNSDIAPAAAQGCQGHWCSQSVGCRMPHQVTILQEVPSRAYLLQSLQTNLAKHTVEGQLALHMGWPPKLESSFGTAACWKYMSQLTESPGKHSKASTFILTSEMRQLRLKR